VKKLSFKKAINFLKVFISFNISKVLKKSIVWGLPYSVSIEPTTSCNLHCLECPSGQNQFTRKTGHITSELYKSIINELYPHLAYLILYFQGEPYLHPNFFDLVNYANKKNIYTASSTNGAAKARLVNNAAIKLTVTPGRQPTSRGYA
jgi:MoaA/NifB/PqqE/SkfB family radical SAM enzyme